MPPCSKCQQSHGPGNQLTLVASLTNTPTESKRRLTFEYDALGRRIRAGVSRWTNNVWLVTSSNKFLYDGWNLVAELNATNNALVRSYAWGLDLSGSMDDEGGGVGGLLWVNDSSTINSQPSTHFVSYDGNGNVTALVDAGSGNETARYEYGPFGDLTQASGLMARANPIRFSSKYHDDATGLTYYGYRYYSPAYQRWLNRDPLGEEGGLNLYGFVENDPVNAVDPLGLEFRGFHINSDGSWRPAFQYPGRNGSRLNWQYYFDKLTSFGCKDQFDADFERIMSEEATDLFPYGSLSYLAIREAISRGYLSEDDLPFGDISLAWNAEHHGYAPNLTVAEAGHMAFLTLVGAVMDGALAASMPAIAGREILEPKLFYSVQSPRSAVRLAAGGEPWPIGVQKANLGQGLYTWGSLADAEAYAAGKTGAQILRFEMSARDYSALRTLDLRSFSDEAATDWLHSYSQYGKGLPHGYDHIIRGAGVGVEYYFSPSAFRLMK